METETIEQELQDKVDCILAGHHGVFIPARFGVRYEDEIKEQFSDSHYRTLVSKVYDEPEFYETSYWQVWEEVLENIEINDRHLVQNGDLFLVDKDLSDEAYEALIA